MAITDVSDPLQHLPMVEEMPSGCRNGMTKVTDRHVRRSGRREEVPQEPGDQIRLLDRNEVSGAFDDLEPAVRHELVRHVGDEVVDLVPRLPRVRRDMNDREALGHRR